MIGFQAGMLNKLRIEMFQAVSGSKNPKSSLECAACFSSFMSFCQYRIEGVQVSKYLKNSVHKSERFESVLMTRVDQDASLGSANSELQGMG